MKTNLITRLFFAAFAVVSFGTSLAQDAYFSHFYYSDALTNPAQSAISEDINLRLLHRSQWMTLVKPFTTSQFEGSFPLRKSVTNEKFGTIGVSFVNDRLGDGGYLSTNQFSLSFAYNLGLEKSNLAFGLKAGYFNGATAIDQITTGSQWNGAAFDPQALIGEDLANPVIKGVEVSPGVMWYQNDSIGVNKHYFGVSAYNLLTPETGEIVEGFGLPMRFTVTGGTSITASDFTIAPKALFMMQGNQNQVVIGTDVLYNLAYTKEKRSAIGIGGYYRMNDAAILGLKYLSNTFDVGVSYDMNVSSLTDGLNTGTGSLELFLNYKIASKKSAKPFLYNVEVYDEKTGELTPADVVYKSITTGEEGTILDNQSSGTADLHLKEEYVITVSKDGYETQTINLKNSKDLERSEKITLKPILKTFDLAMKVFDKESGDALPSQVYLIDENGNETLLGEGTSIDAPLEIGKQHKLIVKSDGYDDQEVDLSYDKYGTLSKDIHMNKSFTGSMLKLIVLDEDTKEAITSTVMVSDVTVSTAPINKLMMMNEMPPAKYPLDLGKKFEILITKEGYFNQTLKIEVSDNKPMERVVNLSALGVGKSIVLDDLLFKTGKAELDERSYRLLDQLVDFMNQNPTLKVEIGGHTDSDGSSGSNQRLSEARAKSAINYLVTKGIERGRLVAKGYGESNPRETNNTPEGKAKNRRVELKIIGK